VNRPNDPLQQVQRQIMWNRLIAVVEEQARTLVRTSFSTAVREAGDLSAGVFDTGGRMLAQAVTGTPGHVNTMAMAVRHFLAEYPVGEMQAGDVYITNDPWIASGHLHDVTVVLPSFYKGKLVALFAAVAHLVDVGGRGMGADGRQVFEEGIMIPILPLMRAGILNQDLMRIMRANTREPLQVEGDLHAIIAANQEGARRLCEMMGEFKIDTLDELAAHIVERSYTATVEAISRLKPGAYRNSMTVDGYGDRSRCPRPAHLRLQDRRRLQRHVADEPVRHQCRRAVRGGIHVLRVEMRDRAGRSEQSRFAGAVPCVGAAGHDFACAPAGTRCRASRHRPDVAGCDLRMP